MKKVLIGAGILIAVIFLVTTVISVLNPQGMADFFMNMVASEFSVEIDGKEQDVKLHKLGDGVFAKDRLFVMQKMIVFYIMKDEEGLPQEVIEEYNQAIADAAEDNKLSLPELNKLKALHSEYVSEEDVSNWIEMAQKYEDNYKQRPTEEEE